MGKQKKRRARQSKSMRVCSKRPRVLFLCTGNYYRSRFAEAYFNFLACAEGWPWRAFSRGLATHWVDDPLSTHTRHHLLRSGIALSHTSPAPLPLTRADLESASHVVALKIAEHRPVMRARFPRHAARVEYWSIHDLDAGLPHDTLAQIEDCVRQLAEKLLKPRRPIASRSVSAPRD